MKYIDAEKLKVEIERRIAAYQKNFDKADNRIAKLSIDGRIASLKGILPFITSLQQEQPEPSKNLVDVDAVREDFITNVYRVLDADSTNDRANAIINAFDSLPTVSQEQPEVDLEKEIDCIWDSCDKHKNERGCYVIWFNKIELEALARYFYELGRNERK